MVRQLVHNGRGQMVSPDDDDKMAEVWMEEIEED
jgi:hypothetical protein